jgi:hypothetical protein
MRHPAITVSVAALSLSPIYLADFFTLVVFSNKIFRSPALLKIDGAMLQLDG